MPFVYENEEITIGCIEIHQIVNNFIFGEITYFYKNTQDSTNFSLNRRNKKLNIEKEFPLAAHKFVNSLFS